jgi:dTDP-4-dehydrorhamnose 3,5-epimerase
MFTETPLPGSFLVEPVLHEDERGFFARFFCEREFQEHGLNPRVRQCNVSYNRAAGTLRGLHYQSEPDAEAKLVQCTRGAAFDVVVDLRLESPSFAKWYGIELSAGNRVMIYIPEGFAHGFQTLTDDTEILYQMSEFYNAGASKGIRWNDPRLAIAWPLDHPIISGRDREFPLFDSVFHSR